MKNKKYRGLLMLNASLVVALGYVTLAPSVVAQSSDRRPGEYIVAGGEMKGQNANAFFILDTENLEMLGIVFDANRKRVDKAVWHSLVEDEQRGSSR